MAGKLERPLCVAGLNGKWKNSSAERFINSFSDEWKDLIRIFLYFENACEKAEKWLRRKCARTAARFGLAPIRQTNFPLLVDIQRPPSQGWYDFVTDLIEKIPVLNSDGFTNEERILCMPAIPQRNLFIFISQNKHSIDGCLFDQLSLFLHSNLNRFDGWCRLVINSGYSYQLMNDDVEEDSTANGKQHHFPSNNETSLIEKRSGVWRLNNSAKEYFGMIDCGESLMSWKLENHFDTKTTICKENDQEISNMNGKRHIEKRCSSIVREKSPEAEEDKIKAKRGKLESEISEEDGHNERIPENDVAIKAGNEQENCIDSYSYACQVVSAGELMEKYPDSKLLCNELTRILSKPLDQIEHICNCLELEGLTEDQVIQFILCIFSDQAAINSHAKMIILKKTLLPRLLSLERAVSRQIFNCVIQLLKWSSSKECSQSVVAPLVLQSRKNSPQEDFILKILKSDHLDQNNYYEILECTVGLSKQERDISESFVKSLEITIGRSLKIPSKLIFDIATVLQQNSAKFEGMVEVPKVIILMIKHYKNEVLEITNIIEDLLHNNKSFLKKRALKELSKTCY